jgi:hypothetical protein
MPIDWSRLDKGTIARFLGIDESEILEIGPTTLRLSDAVPETANFDSIIFERLSRRGELLIAALKGEDDLGVVVRAHIHIEHEAPSALPELTTTTAPIGFDCQSFLTPAASQSSDI